jgi:hypothetical protein
MIVKAIFISFSITYERFYITAVIVAYFIKYFKSAPEKPFAFFDIYVNYMRLLIFIFFVMAFNIYIRYS